MFFNRRRRAEEAQAEALLRATMQLVTVFSVQVKLAQLMFLLVCAGGGEEKYETTIASVKVVGDVVSGLKDNIEPLSAPQFEEAKEIAEERLASLYAFFGEMMFKPLAGDANAVIVELENVLGDELERDETVQDYFMGLLIHGFEDQSETWEKGVDQWDETQKKVIDYLRKRWGIDDERYRKLSEKSFEEKELEAMVKKIAGNAQLCEAVYDQL